jgi:hypothetical protein
MDCIASALTGVPFLPLGLDIVCISLDWISFISAWIGFRLLELEHGLDTGLHD